VAIVTLSAGTTLVPLTGSIVARRLKDPEFSAELPGIDVEVQFGGEWPGDLLGVFTMFASLASGDEAVAGQFIVVDTEQAMAVGAIGTIGEVAPDRSIEIGYGMNRSAWGK